MVLWWESRHGGMVGLCGRSVEPEGEELLDGNCCCSFFLCRVHSNPASLPYSSFRELSVRL